ncbi:hypothetical protein T484DRAFT_1949274 [Baffinella frigidus]|nr:hypothetical protein T484DRAFT_1949274 [Cryptophyta sp. CCMP2293]
MEEHLALDDGQKAGAGGEDARGNDCMYASPQELIDMWERDPAEMKRQFKQALEHFHETGRPRPSDLQLPIRLSPYDTSVSSITGYEGGEFDPARLGVACIVVPPTEGRGTNTKGWSLNPDRRPSKAHSSPELVAVGMSVRAHKGKEGAAPELPGMYFKFTLEQPPVDFLAPHAAPASNHGPYLLFHMPNPGAQTRVAVEELATAEDVADTPADAPSTGTSGAGAETTSDESPDEVTGLIEHLSLAGTAANSDGGAGAGESEGGALGRALVLKTKGNTHFSSGDYSRALPLYLEAIEMLEGAGEDAALATILCNRSVAFLKIGRSASALTDAERARALGGGKAHFRLAEALSALGRYEEAFEAYDAALENAEGGNKSDVRERIAEVKRGRAEVLASAASAARCAHCGVQGVTLKHCTRCMHTWYCGAECQKAAWKGHKETCAPPLPLKDVLEKVEAATATGDWRGVLKWEGRMDEMMEGRSDAICNSILGRFSKAHGSVSLTTASPENVRRFGVIEERRIKLLGKMQRFRDQGVAMCKVATILFYMKEKEAKRLYERARNLGEEHGFYSVESQACLGLGQLELQEGRKVEGLELLRNALAAGSLSEEADGVHEEGCVFPVLILALFAANAIDEIESLLPRFQAAAKAESRKMGRLRYGELEYVYITARLHEARGRPQEAEREVRALLDLIRENRAQLQDIRCPCLHVLGEAARNLTILHPARGEKELIKSVVAELAKLSRG